MTGEQCRTKMKKLCQEYKKLKDYHEETGRKRKKWRFFDKVDDIIGCKPATRPEVVPIVTHSHHGRHREVVLDTSVEGTASNIMSDNGDDDSENESLEKQMEMLIMGEEMEDG